MKKLIGLSLICLTLVTACSKKDYTFNISNGQVGPLNKTVQLKQIDSIFASDSLVKLNPNQETLGTRGEVEVYEKGGAKLMLITPMDERDPNSRIQHIRIFDPRYQTDKGIGLESTFGELEQAYTIGTIQTTISSVVVFLQDADLYITIDKQQLPENLRYDPSVKVEAVQIPDAATFKYLMVGWDHEDTTE